MHQTVGKYHPQDKVTLHYSGHFETVWDRPKRPHTCSSWYKEMSWVSAGVPFLGGGGKTAALNFGWGARTSCNSSLLMDHSLSSAKGDIVWRIQSRWHGGRKEGGDSGQIGERKKREKEEKGKREKKWNYYSMYIKQHTMALFDCPGNLPLWWGYQSTSM